MTRVDAALRLGEDAHAGDKSMRIQATNWLRAEVVRDVARMASVHGAACLPTSADAWLRRRRLSKLLRYAATRSPYYRQLYRREGIGAATIANTPFDRLPCTTKAELREHLHRLGTDDAIRGDRLDKLLAAESFAAPATTSPFVVVRTSGSTSEIFSVVYDRAAWVTARAMAAGMVSETPEGTRKGRPANPPKEADLQRERPQKARARRPGARAPRTQGKAPSLLN